MSTGFLIRTHLTDPGQPMTTTIAKLAVEALIANGIEQLYCLPGVQNDHFFNALFNFSNSGQVLVEFILIVVAEAFLHTSGIIHNKVENGSTIDHASLCIGSTFSVRAFSEKSLKYFSGI